MGTPAQKLQALLSSKTAIKNAIKKFRPSIGDKMRDYADVISTMADGAVGFGKFVSNRRLDQVIIPYVEEEGGSIYTYSTLRSYIFYNLQADEVYIEKGFTTIGSYQFRNLNNGANSDLYTCTLYLPNSIDSFNGQNIWQNTKYVVPVLEAGWGCSFSLVGLNATTGISQETLNNIINALKDCTEEDSKFFEVTEQQYDLISEDAMSNAMNKNWEVIY